MKKNQNAVPSSIVIDGVEFAPVSQVVQATDVKNEEGHPYVVVRTYSAGVHVGYLKMKEGNEVVLTQTRRIWGWAGAFTLSEFSLFGPTKPKECQFSTTIPENNINGWIEILPVSQEAMKKIAAVKDFQP